MTKHIDENEDDPSTALTAYRDWENTWQTLKESEQETDLRLSEELHVFIEQTKQLVTIAEQEKLDASPLVLFLRQDGKPLSRSRHPHSKVDQHTSDLSSSPGTQAGAGTVNGDDKHSGSSSGLGRHDQAICSSRQAQARSSLRPVQRRQGTG